VAVTESEIQAEVLEWFHDNWDPSLSLIEWRTRLLESGCAVPAWSSDWFGKELPAWTDRVAHDVIRHAGGVALPLGAGVGLAAPTLYEHGSDELKSRILAKALTGEQTWCQLFSEPGAGSDLAGMKASAVLDGDTWIVNGQKVWNTSADHADMAILVARTDWEAVKHQGITYFVIDMHQPGVEARPIKQMNYHQSFMEVFMTDAEVPATNVVGQVGGGWAVARATLAHERGYAGRRTTYFAPDAAGRVIDEARDEVVEYKKTYEWYPQRQWTAERAKAARALGRPPGSEGSIGKLATSEVARRSNALHTRIAGARGMLKSADDPVDATIAEVLISTPAQSIAGGTDEIQHNIIGEGILGLPKEPAADRGMPYREVGRP